jgi:hypothetical protein
VAGLLAQVGGVRLAYLLGLVIAAAALVTAVVALPRDTPDTRDAPDTPRGGSVDWMGAALLSLGLVAVLLVTSETALWISDPVVAGVLLAAGIVVLAGWVAVERRVRRPLVDVLALRHPAVATANLVMAVSGIAMYLLFTLISRYMQTPPQAGYGYGLTDFGAGLVLVPFSALGFLAGRVIPRLGQRVGSSVRILARWWAGTTTGLRPGPVECGIDLRQSGAPPDVGKGPLAWLHGGVGGWL